MAHFETAQSDKISAKGLLLIGVGGMRSQVTRQMHLDESTPNWGGGEMWRGFSAGIPTRTRDSFVLMRSMQQRFVCYPISAPDPTTGMSQIIGLQDLPSILINPPRRAIGIVPHK